MGHQVTAQAGVLFRLLVDRAAPGPKANAEVSIHKKTKEPSTNMDGGDGTY